jgi:hypothetical protein
VLAALIKSHFERDGKFDWRQMGRASAPLFRRVPRLSILYGPLDSTQLTATPEEVAAKILQQILQQHKSWDAESAHRFSIKCPRCNAGEGEGLPVTDDAAGITWIGAKRHKFVRPAWTSRGRSEKSAHTCMQCTAKITLAKKKKKEKAKASSATAPVSAPASAPAVAEASELRYTVPRMNKMLAPRINGHHVQAARLAYTWREATKNIAICNTVARKRVRLRLAKKEKMSTREFKALVAKGEERRRLWRVRRCTST